MKPNAVPTLFLSNKTNEENIPTAVKLEDQLEYQLEDQLDNQSEFDDQVVPIFASIEESSSVHNDIESNYDMESNNDMELNNDMESAENYGEVIALVNVCSECETKNELINKQAQQLRTLRKKLKKANQKIWYLEKVKSKLDSAFAEMKNQRILDENLCNTIEVVHAIFCYIINH